MQLFLIPIVIPVFKNYNFSTRRKIQRDHKLKASMDYSMSSGLTRLYQKFLSQKKNKYISRTYGSKPKANSSDCCIYQKQLL